MEFNKLRLLFISNLGVKLSDLNKSAEYCEQDQ